MKLTGEPTQSNWLSVTSPVAFPAWPARRMAPLFAYALAKKLPLNRATCGAAGVHERAIGQILFRQDVR